MIVKPIAVIRLCIISNKQAFSKCCGVRSRLLLTGHGVTVAQQRAHFLNLFRNGLTEKLQYGFDSHSPTIKAFFNRSRGIKTQLGFEPATNFFNHDTHITYKNRTIYRSCFRQKRQGINDKQTAKDKAGGY